MNLERFEPVLRWLDDDRFYRTRASRLAWAAAGIIVLTVLVYIRAILLNGLFWQDQPALNSVASLFTLGHVWTRAADGVYQPLSLALLWVEARGFASLAAPYLGLNLIIHAGNCVLLWLILRRLAVPGAWLAAALFAVHPVQVQTVAWIAQQPHLVGACFFLLTVWLYLRWAQIRPPLPEVLAGMEPEEVPSRSAYGLALLAYVLAVVSDPIAVVVPLVLLLILWWKRGSVTRTHWARLSPFIALAFAGVAATVLFRHPGPELLLAAPVLSIPQRVLIAGRAIEVQGVQIFRLYTTQFIHSRWDPAFGMRNLLPLFLVAAVAIVAWAGRRRWGLVPIFCLLAFVALLLPGLVLVLDQVGPVTYVADYQQYLAAAVPLALIAAGLAWISVRLSSSMPIRAARVIIGVLVIGLLGAFAVIRVGTYQSADTAFKAVLLHNPQNTAARAQYAMWKSDDSPSEAMQILDQAPPADSNDLSLLDARARADLALGDPKQAISDALSAQRLAPDHPGIRIELGQAYDAAAVQAMSEGGLDDASENYNNALAAYEAARQLNSPDEWVRDGIGKVMLHEGRLTESMEQFDAAMDLDSACVAARVHKAQALFNSGIQGDSDKVTAAMTDLHDALHIDPTNFEAFCAAADMQFRMKNYVSAENDYRAALRYHSGAAQVWTELGFAQSAQNRYPEALQSFARALSLRADAPDALRGKRLAELAMGNQKS